MEGQETMRKRSLDTMQKEVHRLKGDVEHRNRIMQEQAKALANYQGRPAPEFPEPESAPPEVIQWGGIDAADWD